MNPYHLPHEAEFNIFQELFAFYNAKVQQIDQSIQRDQQAMDDAIALLEDLVHPAMELLFERIWDVLQTEGGIFLLLHRLKTEREGDIRNAFQAKLDNYHAQRAQLDEELERWKRAMAPHPTSSFRAT